MTQKTQGYVVERQGSRAVIAVAKIRNGVLVMRQITADSAHGTPPALGTPVTVVRRAEGDELL